MMESISNTNRCVGCGACAQICPLDCISMKMNDNGFLYPIIDTEHCVECNKCKRVCPVNNGATQKKILGLYGATNKEREIVKQSSSGGAFFSMAEFVLTRDGIVFGAVIDENSYVKHVAIDNILDIHRLLGSKYVQSDIQDTYLEVYKALSIEKMVLFVGTPCQCAGLKNFLTECGGVIYADLFIVEFICHGVPSPGIWKDYIDYISKGRCISNISFRDKKNGWHDFGISYLLDGEYVFGGNRDDVYYNGFLENLFLRDSCYACDYKQMKTCADISIADFWGNEVYAPELNRYNEDGVSLVTVFSEKGMQLFENIKDSFDVVSLKSHEAYEKNIASMTSANYNKRTRKFYKYRKKHGTIASLNRYSQYTLGKKIYDKIKWKIWKLLGII